MYPLPTQRSTSAQLVEGRAGLSDDDDKNDDDDLDLVSGARACVPAASFTTSSLPSLAAQCKANAYIVLFAITLIYQSHHLTNHLCHVLAYTLVLQIIFTMIIIIIIIIAVTRTCVSCGWLPHSDKPGLGN